MRTTSPIENPFVLLRVPGRDGLFFAFGIFTGMRLSEITSLKWGDVIGQKEFTVRTKRGKMRTFPLVNLTLREKIEENYTDQPLEHYIFSSLRKKNAPLTQKGVNDFVRKRYLEFGVLTDYPSSHSLRKTAGRYVYEMEGVEAACSFLGHSSIETTLRYIGVTKEKRIETYKKIEYVRDPFIEIKDHLMPYWLRIRDQPDARILIERYISSFFDSEHDVRKVLNSLK